MPPAKKEDDECQFTPGEVCRIFLKDRRTKAFTATFVRYYPATNWYEFLRRTGKPTKIPDHAFVNVTEPEDDR